ncbi:MAG: ribulose-phosphate 3-epimerase [Endomicrobiia bacterium]
MKIVPSILTADFSCLKKEISWFDKAGVEIVHLDIMDGHFVPNISFGPAVVKSIRKYTKAIFDVHLMLSEPEKYIDVFANSGADYITFHIEIFNSKSTIKPGSLIKKIHRLNKKAGISLNPDTKTEKIYPYLPELDLILVMSVYPGFGGQKFIPETLKKIEMLRKHIDSNKYRCFLEVDGGIDEKTAPQVALAGADLLVCGNAIFGKKSPKVAYQKLVKVVNKSLDFQLTKQIF